MKLITNTSELIEAIRQGTHSSVGGYPLFFECCDGSVLHPTHVRANALTIARELRDNVQWSVRSIDINWENEHLTCEESNQEIESAYLT